MSERANERPILFSEGMVNAILAGRKSVTRRIATGVQKHIGDRLWVREACAEIETPDGRIVVYRADHNEKKPSSWRPSIHMPRAWSRLTLEVVGVSIERLHAITREEAIAEGCREGLTNDDEDYVVVRAACSARALDPVIARFSLLWDSLNAARGYGWAENPMVQAITFRRIRKRV